MRIIAALALCFFCTTAFPQKKTMYLKDGTTVEFTKIYPDMRPKKERAKISEVTIVRTPKGDQRLINSQIVRYFDPGEDKYVYLRLVRYLTGKVDYVFVEQLLLGTVSVYTERVKGQQGPSMIVANVGGGTSMAGGGSSWVTQYYLGRGDTLQLFNLTEDKEKGNDSTVLEVKALLNDSPEHQARLTGTNGTAKRTLPIVEDYNVSRFRKPAGKTLGTMCFYPDFKTDVGSMTLSVNDSLSLPLEIGKLAVFKVPVDEPSKICFASDKVTRCALMTSWTFNTRNYKIDLRGDDEIEFKSVIPERVQFYLQESKKKADLQKKKDGN